MNDATVKRLNAINREFYRITADSFDQTRQNPWPGWHRLLPYLEPPLSVLDVGCGNGRFGLFLASHLGAENLVYHGFDNNPALLDRARAALSDINTQLEARDMVENPPETGAYDLVALFGMLHHIPGRQQRRDFMRVLAERVAPGGLLAFAAWRFYDFPRFRDRITPWPENIQVEPGDYLLDWRQGAHAQRYCHHVDDAEHADLVTATGLTEIATFRADGRTNDANHYSLLRREPA
ncbi:MAG: class I SAM-dependent methyltransferase [Anaerolineae bacterium]|nr:class I SAM-dependent methyltransferase [Anaerolineae bacterium]